MNDVYATMAAQKVLMCSREETEEFKRILAEEDARYEQEEINGFFGLDALVLTFGQDPQEVDKAQEALERLLEFWDVRQGTAIAALARYLQYRVVRFYECAHCGADLSQEAVETEVGRFCSTQCAELEE